MSDIIVAIIAFVVGLLVAAVGHSEHVKLNVDAHGLHVSHNRKLYRLVEMDYGTETEKEAAK
jgi:hypothetical protein